jgi:hypothetical protein
VVVFELTEINTGASGEAEDIGVTEEDEDDGREFPAEFVANTVNVYEMLFVNPLIVIGDEDPVEVIPPGLDTTV